MTPRNVYLVSLGCPKNLVDSEVYLGNICSQGFRVTPDPAAADILMVNTCGFIENAKVESIDTIFELVGHKENDPRKRIVVTGCLGQRYPEDLAKEIPEVDAIVGLSDYPRLPDILRELIEEAEHPTEEATAPRLSVHPPDHPAFSEGSRLRLTPPHTTYLRISEGCDNPCTFCSIPSFRGRFRSKPLEVVIEEAQELVASGALELNLISQDLTSYGVDLGGEYLLPRLLEALNDRAGAKWIRLLYTYPYRFSDSMIDAVANLERVVNYIDMPIQHISDRMLKRMGRRMGGEPTRALFARMRERIPEVVLRSTFIVGFPGEGDADFQQLLDFIEEARLERVGVFTYSDEDGTPAVRLDGKIPAELAEERLEKLMLAQQQVAFDWNRERIGSELELLLDGVDRAPGRERWHGRSYAEAPEIDSRIFVEGTNGAPLRPGSLLRARITGVEGYDLVGEPVKNQ